MPFDKMRKRNGFVANIDNPNYMLRITEEFPGLSGDRSICDGPYCQTEISVHKIQEYTYLNFKGHGYEAETILTFVSGYLAYPPRPS